MKFIQAGLPDDFSSGDQGLPSILRPRLTALLTPAPQDTLLEPQSAHTARGWLDLAHEAAYAEDFDGALAAIEKGLAVADHQPEVKLSLLRTAASVQMAQPYPNQQQRSTDPADEAAAMARVRERSHLLRELGQPRRAELEEQLGFSLIAYPESFDLTILNGVLEDERAKDALDTVAVDVLSVLAMYYAEENPEDALNMVEEALELHRRQAAAGVLSPVNTEVSLLRIKAHLKQYDKDFVEARKIAQSVLEQGCNRVTRADMWAILGRSAYHEDSDVPEAMRYTLRALEMFARLGIRYGAVATASMIASLASSVEAHEISVLAWKVAVLQAQLGEMNQTPALQLALGHQLLEAQQPEAAEKLLRELYDAHRGSSNHQLTARIRVSLGQALQSLERSDEAVVMWDQAIETLIAEGEVKNAARLSLGTASLLTTHYDDDDRADSYYARAVELAREASSDLRLLTHALHLHSRALFRRKDPQGLTVIDEAIRNAQQMQAPWFEADFMISKARGLWKLDQSSKAVATALNAADIFSEVSDVTQKHRAEILAGEILVANSQGIEAQAVLSGVVDEESIDTPIRVEALNALSQAFELTGDVEQATKLRDQADRLLARRR